MARSTDRSTSDTPDETEATVDAAPDAVPGPPVVPASPGLSGAVRSYRATRAFYGPAAPGGESVLIPAGSVFQSPEDGPLVKSGACVLVDDIPGTPDGVASAFDG